VDDSARRHGRLHRGSDQQVSLQARDGERSGVGGRQLCARRATVALDHECGVRSQRGALSVPVGTETKPGATGVAQVPRPGDFLRRQFSPASTYIGEPRSSQL